MSKPSEVWKERRVENSFSKATYFPNLHRAAARSFLSAEGGQEAARLNGDEVNTVSAVRKFGKKTRRSRTVVML